MSSILEVLGPALLLFQEQVSSSAAGMARFFAGFVLILILYTSALLFTWWISKDE